jgi:hypothetical protein
MGILQVLKGPKRTQIKVAVSKQTKSTPPRQPTSAKPR